MGHKNIELDQSSLSHVREKLRKISENEKKVSEKEITMIELEQIIIFF